MTIGKRIRKARLNKDILAKDLAAYIGVTGKTMSDWEHDKHRPGAYYIPLIAEKLDCTVNYLLYGDNPIISLSTIVEGKRIDEIEVAPRIDNNGFYFAIRLEDGTIVTFRDRILYRRQGQKYAKEITKYD